MKQKKTLIVLVVSLFLFNRGIAQTYNPLWIPDTLTGPTFNLTAKDTFKQILTGNQTITAGYNGNWWGPTMIWHKGSTVNLNVVNKLQDSTTVHWHGMHLAAVMDGGPHQIIPPKTTWSPYFTVSNNAGLYWYHPHLHMQAVHQITSGLGGLIIVRDDVESALKLSRAYGVDDIPLILSDRRFDNTNQLVDVAYGDTMVTNGVLSAGTKLPAQVVRFRILNASLERAYNIGFSDNRTFYVITTDGGLVDKPVAVTRFMISSAERVEILVDLSKDNGKTLDMKAYNASLPKGVSGFEPANFPGPLANKLGARNFNILHIDVTAATSNAVTAIPTALVTNTFWDPANAKITRKIAIADSIINGRPTFSINHKVDFDINYFNYQVKKGDYEIWEISNTSVIAHPFHIHDIEFHIISRNGKAAPDVEQGWKDVVLINQNETVKFIGKFEDFADSLHPFMYHCHIAPHEDAGLMAQFVVVNSLSGINDPSYKSPEFVLYPNPATNKLMIKSDDPDFGIYYITVTDLLGRTMYMMPKPRVADGIDISGLAKGTYHLTLIDNKNKASYTKTFVKE